MHETELKSSWSGSMQLMAGVKACTKRYLANHPHFEDKWLRDRTFRLYQVMQYIFSSVRRSLHSKNLATD